MDGFQQELGKYGKKISLVYDGGSIKRRGIYNKVVSILRRGKAILENEGVMPNPTTEKLKEGIERAKAVKANFILAVRVGSVCD